MSVSSRACFLFFIKIKIQLHFGQPGFSGRIHGEDFFSLEYGEYEQREILAEIQQINAVHLPFHT